MKKFLILMIMLNAVILNGFSQDNPELLVLNNLSKTVSKVNTQDDTIVQDWLVVDNSPTNTSPNDMLIYNNKLYVIISMTTPALRVFDLTTGLQVEEYEFTAYSNPFAIERVGNALYVTLAGFNKTVVFEVENITKPEETKTISANAKLFKPEDVSEFLIKAIQRKKFMIIPGFDGRLTFLMKRLLLCR